MPGGHWRMRREHALTSHLLNIFASYRRPARALRLLLQLFHGEQRRMPLIHVIAHQLRMPQSPKHADSANPQQHFLR